MDRSKDGVAYRLARAHFLVEPGIERIFRVLSSATREADPGEPVKLLELNRQTTADGIRPIFFGPHTGSGIFYPSVIIEITPEEFDAIAGGALAMPDDWHIGPEIPREDSLTATGSR